MKRREMPSNSVKKKVSQQVSESSAGRLGLEVQRHRASPARRAGGAGKVNLVTMRPFHSDRGSQSCRVTGWFIHPHSFRGGRLTTHGGPSVS